MIPQNLEDVVDHRLCCDHCMKTDHEFFTKKYITGMHKLELIVGEHQRQKWSLFPLEQGTEIYLSGYGRHASVSSIDLQL